MSIKNTLLSLMALAFASSSLYATNEDVTKDKLKQILSQKSKQEISEYYKNFHSRNFKLQNFPIAPGNLLKSPKFNSDSKIQKAATQLSSVPADLTVPGEYEELEAVVVTWPYYNLDETGAEVSILFDGIGLKPNYATQQYEVVACTSIPDTEENSDFPPLFLDMIDGIQKHAEVWMNVASLNDTVAIKAYATAHGKPLTNVKFIEHNTNSFWYRDCGPVAFYYDNLDKVGLIDFEYYPGRPIDDEVPIVVSEFSGYPILKSSIEYEGGNILVDGKDVLFTSTMLAEANSDDEGQYYIDYQRSAILVQPKNPLTMQQCKDSLVNVMNLKAINVMPTFLNDGGTGHIDLYADNLDENTFVFSKFPTEMYGQADYNTAKTNIAAMLKIISQNGVAYNANYIPFPRKDNGTWYPNDEDYSKYTRTYSNHLVVNNAIIQPIFNNGTTGDVAGDNEALKEIQAAYPGYEIVPVDMRAFDGFGGSIHCITKQIPAQNPIRIFHRPLTSADVKDGNVNVPAEIKSNKDITKAQVFYRNSGETEFKTVDMSVLDASQSTWTATIPVETLTDGKITPVEYYISGTCEATGKTITKPFVAPKAWFTIDNQEISAVEDEVTENAMQVYPNPATSNVFAKFMAPAGNYTVQITDLSGAVRFSESVTNPASGEQVISLNGNLLAGGTYLLTIIDSKGKTQTMNFVITK